MSYLARLKSEFPAKRHPIELTKPTEAPSVGSVSASSSLTPENEAHPDDDRIRCEDCENAEKSGRCLAAWRGEIPHASRAAGWLPDTPHRCEAFKPRPALPDRRNGYERWPGLAIKERTHHETINAQIDAF